MNSPIKINSKEIQLMKPLTEADYDSKTVLTNSSWEYVELWLRRQHGDKARRALFFWSQAKCFFDASEILPIESRPLTSYYCCMNAAKALLAVRGNPKINFDNISHGITSDRNQWMTDSIANAKVIFQGGGVLFELSRYLGEEAKKEEYCVYDLLYNIPCIHRAFSITYQQAELFVPIKDINFVYNPDIKKGWIQFKLDNRYANGYTLKLLPSNYEKVLDGKTGKWEGELRSKKRFEWDIHKTQKKRLLNLTQYHKKIRKDFHYIYSDQRLWYIKKQLPKPKHSVNRSSVTLIYAVMHWMSELVRYNPEKFDRVMKTKQNWVLHQFVDTALYQFIDEISCEITRNEIMTSGYRK